MNKARRARKKANKLKGRSAGRLPESMLQPVSIWFDEEPIRDRMKSEFEKEWEKMLWRREIKRDIQNGLIHRPSDWNICKGW